MAWLTEAELHYWLDVHEGNFSPEAGRHHVVLLFDEIGIADRVEVVAA